VLALAAPVFITPVSIARRYTVECGRVSPWALEPLPPVLTEHIGHNADTTPTRPATRQALDGSHARGSNSRAHELDAFQLALE
jgi:hypothetical protein